MTTMRSCLRDVVIEIPGNGGIQSPKDLQRALGIHYKLAWQVYRIATASSPIREAGHVPQRAAMEKFIQKVKGRAGVAAKHIDALRSVTAELEDLIQTHAGDRAAFDTMVAGLAEDTVRRVDLSQRKAAYKVNSDIWGIQIRAKMACMIFRPSEDDPDFNDVLLLRGLVGVRRLRKGPPVVVSALRHYDGRGVIDESMHPAQIDFGPENSGLNLLREFCSDPLPEIRNYRPAPGVVLSELINRDVGASAAFTVFICDFVKNTDVRFHDKVNYELALFNRIQYPTEVAVTDGLIHEDTYRERPLQFSAETRNFALAGEHHPKERDVLFSENAVEHLARGADGLFSPDYARYVEMIRYVMERVGWDSDAFDAYRYRLDYPVMPSEVAMKANRPHRPESS